MTTLLTPLHFYQPQIGSEPDRTFDLERSIVGHWPLNENNGLVAYDISPNKNNGTISGSGPFWEGWPGEFLASHFNASDNQIEVPASSNYQEENGAWSLWVNSDGNHGAGGGSSTAMLMQIVEADGDPRLSLRMSTGGSISGHARSAPASTIFTVSSSAIYADRRWHHILFVFGASGQTVYLYVDGIQVATDTAASTWSIVLEPLRIGKSRISFWGFYSGAFADVKIYNTRPTAADAMDLFLAGPWGSWSMQDWAFDEVAAAAGVTPIDYRRKRFHPLLVQ